MCFKYSLLIYSLFYKCNFLFIAYNFFYYIYNKCLLYIVTSKFTTVPISNKDKNEIKRNKSVVGVEEASSHVIILKTLSKHIWPANNIETKARVVISLSALMASKICTVQVPFFFKGTSFLILLNY